MRVLILGAGALGSLVGARLSRTSAAVNLLTTNEAHARAIRRDGLRIRELDGSVSTYPLESYHRPEDVPGTADLALVLVKTPDTRKALEGAASLFGPDTVSLTLQNGIGNWEVLADTRGANNVLAGTTAQGATLVEPGLVRHGGDGPTYIGEPGKPPGSRVDNVVRLFNEAGLEAHPEDDVETRLWIKLMINTGINAVTAITGAPNGFVADNPHAREICREAVREAAGVARAEGIVLPEDIENRVLDVARATAANRSSMLQDVTRGRPTEIGAINEAIVERGGGLGIDTPVNRCLVRLIKAIETTSHKGDKS